MTNPTGLNFVSPILSHIIIYIILDKSRCVIRGITSPAGNSELNHFFKLTILESSGIATKRNKIGLAILEAFSHINTHRRFIYYVKIRYQFYKFKCNSVYVSIVVTEFKPYFKDYRKKNHVLLFLALISFLLF